MKYVQLLTTGGTALLERGQPPAEEILPAERGAPQFLNGTVKNESPTYRLGVTFFVDRREVAKLDLAPLERADVKNQPCDRLIVDIEMDESVSMALYSYTFQQVQADSDAEAVAMLARSAMALCGGRDAEMQPMEWVRQSFNQSLNAGSTLSWPVLPRQDLVVRRMGLTLAGLDVGPLAADKKAALQESGHGQDKDASRAAATAVLAGDVGAQPIPADSHVLLTRTWRVNGVPVANPVSEWVTPLSRPYWDTGDVYWRQRRPTQDPMSFELAIDPSGLSTTAEATYIGTVYVEYWASPAPAVGPL